MATTENLGAQGSNIPFEGFVEQDFDAYEKKKWASNKYSLQRRRAKDKLLALANAVESELSDDLDHLEMGASDEAPSMANGRKVQAQWVFFTRSAADRASLKPLLQRTDLQAGADLFDIAVQHQHACLMLRLDYEGFAVGIELATKAKVDRDNASEKLKQDWAQDKMISLCQALPGGSTIGHVGDQQDALRLEKETVVSWTSGLLEPNKDFEALIKMDRDEEILASDALIGNVVEQVKVFLELFNFIAWSHENDLSQVKDSIGKKKKAEKKKAPVTLEPGSRVTILSGLFAGRGGYFSEVDSKGRAKVMVGPVSVTVDVKDLKPT